MAETLILNTGCWEWWFGISKAIHMEVEKQLFGKQMFAGPVCLVNKQDTEWTLISKNFPSTLSSDSLQIFSDESSIPVTGLPSKFFTQRESSLC